MKKIREIVIKIFKSESVSGYLNILSLFLIVSICIRIFNAIFFLFERTAPEYFIVSQLPGFIDDFVFLAYVLLLLLPIYLVFYFAIGKRSADGIAIGVFVFYALCEIILNWYFSLSMIPFTYHTIYGVGVNQATLVASIYGFEKSYLALLIPIVLILFMGLWKTKKIIDKPWLKNWSVVIFSAGLVLSCFVKLETSDFISEVNYQSARNKVGSFIESYLVYLSEKSDLQNLDTTVELEKYYAINDISKVDYYDYPFFSEAPVRNPLGTFFPVRDSAPNIVFIICESLGKQFSGDDARLGSFTPFLDSLADHSLYWSNFMANAERTFGALPNILGGLPEGETGFMNLRHKSPDHFSLPQLLKENNGYQTAFFCGAIKEFDHMDEFLMTEKFDLIKSKSDFKSNQNKSVIEDKRGNKKQFNWGAEDREVFRQSLQIIDSNFLDRGPYCNVYLTTSFHEPFNYSNQDYFIQLARERINDLDPPKKSEYHDEIETFAALMYMDFALKEFITSYQLRPEFDNTVFVICGDHSINLLGGDSRLEKFHVPLVIYSPMLLKSYRIKSMSCQKDLPAALQGLLKENFSLNLPPNAISQSDNLGISEKFETANCKHVLMYADRRMNACVWNNYLYMDDAIYQIRDNLKIELIDEPQILQNLKEGIRNYRLISNYVCDNNKWIPAIVHGQYSNTRILFSSKIDFEVASNVEAIFPSHLLTSPQAFSGNKSLSNLNDEYLNLLKNVSIDSKKRVRLKLKFAIKASGDQFPSVVIYKNEEGGKVENETGSQTFFLNKDNPDFIQSEKEGWFIYEVGLWLDNTESDRANQKLGVFLFDKNGNQFFVDNLEIELREF